MRYSIIIVLLFCFIEHINAQNNQLLIKVCDKKNHEILPLSSIYNHNLRVGTISDEEGKAKITFNTKNDSISISYLGYKKKVIQLFQLTTDTIFLEPYEFELSTVTISAIDYNSILNELMQIINTSKKQGRYIKGKSSFLIQSFVNNNPLERQESIGNFECELGALKQYDLLMGRFGQSKKFSFYTFSAKNIIKRINLFDFNENFPEIITQCNKRKIKKTYILNKSKNGKHTTIDFTSKNGKQFSGKISYDEDSKQIIYFEGHISSPDQIKLLSIITKTEIKIDSLSFLMSFSQNPYQLNHIKVWYNVPIRKENILFNIQSNILFLVNETNNLYDIPYWKGIGSINLTNYQKITSQYFDKNIWNSGFLFNDSKSVQSSYNYFKENGLVMNFDKHSNHSQLNYFFIQDTDYTPILFDDLNSDSTLFGLSSEKIKDVNQRVYQSDLSHFSIYYLLEKVFDSTSNQYVFSTKTMFDKYHSYYFLNKNLLSLLTINLYLDVFRKNNIELNHKLKTITDQKIAIQWVNKYYKSSNLEAEMLFHDLNDQNNIERLIEKNERIEHALQKDNLKNIITSSNLSIFFSNTPNFINTLFQIAKSYDNKCYHDNAFYLYEYMLQNNDKKLDEKTKNFITKRVHKLQKK